MITRAYRLLKENPNPSEEEIRYWMAGNLCRCTGYQNIVKAVAARGEEARVGTRLNRPGPIGEFAMPDDKSTLRTPNRPARNGASRLRKEDARFIRGRGTYVDDIKLPGMLFGAMVRSPYAHARIKSIDKAKALAVAGCRRGADRRRLEAGQVALDAHPGRRRAGGAGRRQGCASRCRKWRW